MVKAGGRTAAVDSVGRATRASLAGPVAGRPTMAGRSGPAAGSSATTGLVGAMRFGLPAPSPASRPSTCGSSRGFCLCSGRTIANTGPACTAAAYAASAGAWTGSERAAHAS